MKHTPARHAHKWLISFVNHDEVGVCSICKERRVFDADARRRFGNEAIEHKDAAIRRPK